MTLKREEIYELDRQSFAKDGAVIFKSDDNLGAGAGIAPTAKYAGFIVGGSGATITSITYLEPTKYKGSLVSATFPVVAGQFYPVEFTTMTITAGAVMLINKS